jgi:hypothetical protein
MEIVSLLKWKLFNKNDKRIYWLLSMTPHPEMHGRIEIEIEIVFNNTRINRLLCLALLALPC